MAMRQNGLAKLIEECGEVLQVAGKMVQYPATQTPDKDCPILHPDGTDLIQRLEEEIADVNAAARFVVKKMNLNRDRINNRLAEKLKLFEQWDKES